MIDCAKFEQTVSDHCHATGEQNCHRCEDLECCDNENKQLKEIAALKSRCQKLEEQNGKMKGLLEIIANDMCAEYGWSVCHGDEAEALLEELKGGDA